MATSPGQAPKVQIDVTANTEDAVKKIAEVGTSAEKMADKVETVTTKSGRTFEKITSGAGQAAAAADRATNTIVKSIQRAQAAEAAGGRDQPDYYLNIAKQRGANISVIEKEVEKLKQLREANLANNASLADGATRLDKYGNTAKQTAAALRQVPAQFTDIVVSLQGGQAPLTVLLQQGGQLRDIFGSAGAAAQALGSYVAGLINPFTLVAAAAAAIGYAFLQGSKEAEAFNKTLILTGGAAGVSADRLSDMARSISATNANITQSKAAEVLNGIAASGAIASDRLQKYTETAIRFEKAGGGAAEEVGKAFADLAADPLNAVEKLNKSTNFLTAEIYNQIKALDDQGRSTEAARVAQEAYNDALNDRIPKLVDNLWYLEKAWSSVKGAAAEAWDAMLDVGRPQTLTTRLEAAEKLLAEYEGTLPGRRTTETMSRIAAAGGVEGLREQIAGLRELRASQDQSDLQQRERLAREKAGVDFAKQEMQYLSNRKKMENEIAEAKELGRKADLSQAKIEERILLIRDKYKEKTKKDTADPFAGERQAAKDWAQFYERFADANIEAQSAADGLTNTQKDLVRFLLSPAYQKMDEPARQLDLAQAYAAINTEATTKAIKEQEKATRSLAAAERGLQQDLAAQQAQYDREQAAIGRGGRARSIAGGISQINDRYRSQREKVQDRIASFDVSDAERQALEQQLTLIDEYNRKATESYIKHFNDIEEAQGNWVNGANEAINNYLDNNRNVAKMTEDLFTKSISGMEDALVTFVATGKLSFRDLANSIIQDLIRIQIRKALVGLFGGIDLGNFFGSTSSSSSIYSLAGSGSGGLGLQARADGGPVDANSMYLVGERGPELFVPNTSGTILPNGVTPGGVTVNQVINVTTGVQQTVRAEIVSLMPQIAGAAKAAVADAKLRGGSYAAALR